MRNATRFERYRAFGYGHRLIGALLVLGSAVIHFSVTPMHLQEYAPYGVFFVALGVVQVALAAAIVAAPSRRLLGGAALLSLGVSALWLVSRTVGLPIAPQPWRPEELGPADVLCSTMEVAAALLLGRLALRRRPPRPRRRLTVTLAASPAALAVVLMTAVGAGAAVDSMPVAYNVSPARSGQPSTSVTSLTERPGPEPVDRFTLTARPARIDGQDAWTFNGTVPGPELRVRQGDRVQIRLVNHLSEATTIH